MTHRVGCTNMLREANRLITADASVTQNRQIWLYIAGLAFFDLSFSASFDV